MEDRSGEPLLPGMREVLQGRRAPSVAETAFAAAVVAFAAAFGSFALAASGGASAGAAAASALKTAQQTARVERAQVSRLSGEVRALQAAEEKAASRRPRLGVCVSGSRVTTPTLFQGILSCPQGRYVSAVPRQ